MPKIDPHPRKVETASAIDGKRTRYTFTGVPGLILDCSPAGDRSWFCRYQVGHGRDGRKERFLRLGSFAPDKAGKKDEPPDNLTYAQARTKAGGVLAGASDGVDAFADARRVAVEAAVDAVAASHTYEVCFLAPRTDEEYVGIYERHVKDRMGATPVSKLTRQCIDVVLKEIFDATYKPEKGQRGLQATKAYQNIHSVLEWCVEAERLTANPARAPTWLPAKENPDGKQSRAPTDTELRQLWIEGPKCD
jgi:hypothetical protein